MTTDTTHESIDGQSASIDDRTFLAGLAEHRLVLQRCQACGRVRHPPMPTCPWCAGGEFDHVDVSGQGEVYSWVRVHVPFREEFRDDVPYTVVTVSLDAGCRMFARLEGAAPDELIGTRVQAHFVEHDSWTECRFAATGASA